jgi:hypothetical protein
MNTGILKFILLWFTTFVIAMGGETKAQTTLPVTDVGAGIQREALWTQEKGILSKINWYNILIEALNGDIKGLTGEILGIDQKMLNSLEKVSALIKDYGRVEETRELLGKVVEVYTEKLPLLVQDENFTAGQAAAIVRSFDIILEESRQLTTSILTTILRDDLFLMDDKQRYDTINEVYTSVKQHYGTISYLYNKLLYASYIKSNESGTLETFALYYSLYR